MRLERGSGWRFGYALNKALAGLVENRLKARIIIRNQICNVKHGIVSMSVASGGE